MRTMFSLAALGVLLSSAVANAQVNVTAPGPAEESTFKPPGELM